MGRPAGKPETPPPACALRGLAGAIAPALRCACSTPAGGPKPPASARSGGCWPWSRGLTGSCPARDSGGRGKAMPFLIRPARQAVSRGRDHLSAKGLTGVLFRLPAMASDFPLATVCHSPSRRPPHQRNPPPSSSPYAAPVPPPPRPLPADGPGRFLRGLGVNTEQACSCGWERLTLNFCAVMSAPSPIALTDYARDLGRMGVLCLQADL